ncbi:uncharacterized protein ACR2FA_000690 [Aphomia sociella]
MTTTQELFNCIFCKETFQDKEALQIHFRKHGDPNFNTNTRNKVRRHETQTSNDKSNEEGERVSCDVCSEVFPTISKAITHKHKIHPDHDAKYFCPWCGKLFTMKHLYNKHLMANHENAEMSMSNEFHCDPCNVTFYIASAMLYHNKFFHRQDTELPTIGQSKKVKISNQEAIQIFYCTFCGEEYNNKVNLHKHIGDDHCDENQSPEEILRCPLCDAIFYHLDAYELHITYHSTEDLYSEKNQLAEEITEFSLETVPPIVEKVENYDTHDDPETTINALGIENFLQLAIDQSVDNEETSEFLEDSIKIKSKKHKKHKKSKKPAITLDEFLNMNKDVFGEGLDFQGVEEIPTRAVAKRLKVKKQPASKTGSKATSSKKDLEKLKKQGIVVKMKSLQNPITVGTKVEKAKSGKIKEVKEPNTNKVKPANQTQVKSNVVSMSSEVLTKLIITPSKPENVQKLSSSEKGESDIIPRDVSSDKEHDKNHKIINDSVDSKNNENTDDDVTNANTYKNNICEDLNSSQAVANSDIKKNYAEPVKNIVEPESNTSCESPKHNYVNSVKADNSINPLKTLRNVSQHITIKPVGQSTTIVEKSRSICEEGNDNDHIENMTDDKIKQNENKSKIDDSGNASSLKALKHLSNFITVKPVLQTNIVNQKETNENTVKVSKQSPSNINLNDSDISPGSKIVQANDSLNESDKSKNETIKRLDALKILNRNITVKSLASSPRPSERASSDEDYSEESVNTNISPVINKNIKEMSQNKSQNQFNSIKSQTPNRLPNIKVASPMSSPEMNIRTANITSKDTESVKSAEKSNMRSNVVLLKNLANVTAKPVVNPVKNIEQVKLNKIVKQATNIVQKSSTPKIAKKEDLNEEIEIFNIDDSDSDEEKLYHSENQTTKKTNSTSTKSNDALKNLSQHITIKTPNQQVTQKRNAYQLDTHKNDSSFDESDDEHQQGKTDEKSNLPQQNSKNIILQKTLKNLSKQITITSRNSSPCSSLKSQDQNTQDVNEKSIMNDDESDSDSCSSKVKITELNDDDDVEHEDVDNIYDPQKNSNIIIQSPDEMSDNEQYPEETDEQFIDIESKLVANTLQKLNQNLKPHNEYSNLDTLKNISKNITVKTVNEKRAQQSEIPVIAKAATSAQNNLNKELQIKPKKHSNQIPQNNNEDSVNRSNITIEKNKRPIKQTINKNISNQVSAINKEITVKTFEKKTVIQEITTTVTKTIKTIQQEVQTTTQSTSTPTIRPQKVQEMKQYQQSNNKYQGIVVRHASPVCGTKIRSAVTPVRPVVGTTVRHSNQLVPVRPSSNVRAVTPRMPCVKKNIGTTSIQNPNIKTPVKNPSNAMKRCPSQESSGPFSCFKKPKESLIPVSDVPSFSGERDGGSTVQYASATHVSKTNVMNVTKTVKGNTSSVTTQMRSEVSSNSQQLSRLSNVTGLKIVKTSQIKQASNVEQNKDVSASKRTTLEAIEKLQKHGLLVKKPRLDVQNNDNNSERSDDEDGENFPQESEEDFAEEFRN